MKKTLNVLRGAYYVVGIIGMALAMPFYIGIYGKKGR